MMAQGAASRTTDQQGFTLIEVMIVMALTAVLLAAVGNTTQTVSQTVDANHRRAEVAAESRRTIRRIGSFLRPAKLSSFAAVSVDDDVTALRATAAGEWIPPSESVWRPGIRFVAASGLKSMNAALNTSPREIVFEMDANEIDNDIDDDGDGMIDEGLIRLRHDLSTVAMVRRVESCEFLFEGRLLVVRVQLAESNGRGGIFRTQLQQAFYMRNN